eukprot:scaffold1809_cov386-Prasinococcus_capsulatus_cf.AAC.5
MCVARAAECSTGPPLHDRRTGLRAFRPPALSISPHYGNGPHTHERLRTICARGLWEGLVAISRRYFVLAKMPSIKG